ncbi:MAG: arsenate reductase family protein [Synergistaceae bacterium]|nr:arsenate reductase family protein [Synergistaceae bacterium]
MLFVCYPRCTTCQRARAWLDERGIQYEFRDIKSENPSATEIEKWRALSGLPLKSFFNTSGNSYKNLELKDRLPGMSEEEQVSLLSSDGLLVKRPILVGDGFVLVGFKPDEWGERLAPGRTRG